uniref:Fluoride ion transporter CrcB n=1 Tax=Peronospora matthiolae TaxID=2874970 RepID=A0AAV1V7K7_9STRA
MQTIAEDFAILATPGSFSLPGPGSTSSTTREDRIPSDVIQPSRGMPSIRSSTSEGACKRVWCGVSRESMDRHVPVVMSVVIGAYLGVGIRVLLTEFANVISESQADLLELLGFGYFLPNVVGCFAMGLAARVRPILRGQYDVLLTGATTGFCGSCTTFAGWDLGVALMFVRGRWLTATLVLCIHVASAITSLRLGFHVSDGVVHYFTMREYPFRKPPVNLPQLNLDLETSICRFREMQTHTFGPLVARRVQATEEALVLARDSCNELTAEITQVEHEQQAINHHSMIWVVAALTLTALFWTLAFCGFDNYPSSRLLAVCFAPWGALLRWYLSMYNSEPMCRRFPFFTFWPNLSASCLSCAMEIVRSIAYHDSASSYRDFVMFGQGGVMVGFLGSFSTVSTWVYELDNLSSRRLIWAYRYGLISIVVAQLASVFILGMYSAYGSDPFVE